MKRFLIGLLCIMILWDLSLHLQELIKIPHYISFSGRTPYNIFWSIYWGTAFIISLIIFNKEKTIKK